MTMANVRRPPWVDGEKIPDDMLRDVFRPAPDIPTIFHRSSLIIGARGAGKTTLFRYLKAIHNGTATDISLATELASITKQTGMGPLSFEIAPGIEPMIVGKATSLIALSVVAHLVRKGISVPKETLAYCLPDQVRPQLDSLELARIQANVASTPLQSFLNIAESQPLKTLVSDLGQAAQRTSGPLLLLFDRADMVPSPALLPVFELLDQSNEHVILIATRPGLVGRSVEDMAQILVPGDAYDVIHLGTAPRSQQWLNFVQAAVEAQFGSEFSRIPEEIKAWITLLARDSVRWALEMVYGYISAPTSSEKDALGSAILNLQENQLSAAQRTLREYLPDFRRLIKDIHREATKREGLIVAPVIISIPRGFPNQLPPTVTHVDRLMTIALRIGALCMVEGQRWVPGLRITEFEIPPLLLWKKGDPTFRHYNMQPIVIEQTEKLLLRAHRGRGEPPPPEVFIAFRLKFEESQNFRSRSEETIIHYPGLTRVKVTDGRVPVGARWADTIRDRIGKSKAVLGDVSGMRVDVIFELGFAYGLGKPIIPAVSRESEIGLIPRWLGATQVGHFENQAGLTNLAAALIEHLTNPEFQKAPKPPQPVPGLAVWVRALKWNEQARQQFETQGRREGLRVELINSDTPVQKIIERAASSSLLVVSLDGTEEDTLMHFICGAVVAKPKVGYARNLERKILVIQLPSQYSNFAADSLLRCEDIVLATGLDAIGSETQKYGNSYQKWSSTPLPSKKERKK